MFSSFRCCHAAVISALLLCCSCSNRITSLDSYNEWLNDNSHGCLQSKTIAGVNIEVKYQPPSYVVSKQLKAHQKEVGVKDSLLNIQNKLITFLVTLSPDKRVDKSKQVSSLMYEGVTDQAAFNKRVMEMNFFMEQYISLYIDGAEKHPVLAIVENLYELSDSRTFVVVFAPDSKAEDLLKGKEYLFVYDDPFYKMGKVQLHFSGNQLKHARALEVAWN